MRTKYNIICIQMYIDYQKLCQGRSLFVKLESYCNARGRDKIVAKGLQE